nr:MAG TPA: hypothetical protein [Bacteriophage sp.]
MSKELLAENFQLEQMTFWSSISADASQFY